MRRGDEDLSVDDAEIDNHRVDTSLRSEVAWACFLALMLAIVLGVGAPPSDFAPRNSVWWALEPLMIPALGAGMLLAVAAYVANALPSIHRVGAILCIAAALSTAMGTVVAHGISDRASLRVLVVQMAFLAIPVLAALHAMICEARNAVRHDAVQQAVAADAVAAEKLE